VIFINTKRPTFLTIWLVWMTISGVYGLYSYTLGSANIVKAIPAMDSWVLPAFTLISVVNLIAIAMLWAWKKLGFYLVLATAIVAFLINIMVLGVGWSVLGWIGVAILYLAMKPVWQSFK
jgi:hypothetical protein